MKLYYFLGRLLNVPLAIGFNVYCMLTGNPRVRVIVKNQDKDILLVQSWTSSDEWGFPGGGVDRGESYKAAACRELREETGITISEDQLASVGKIHTWGHDEFIFMTTCANCRLPEELPHRYEIKAADWFASTSLPKLGRLARQIAIKVDTNQ